MLLVVNGLKNMEMFLILIGGEYHVVKSRFETRVECFFLKEKLKAKFSFDYRLLDANHYDVPRSTLYDGKKPSIIFSIPDDDVPVSFYDYVECIVDANHEVQHCLDFLQLKKSSFITDKIVDFVPTLYNHDYYAFIYEHCYFEVNAEILGIERARKYLYKKYPHGVDDIDVCLLQSGRAWFENVASEIGIGYVSDNIAVFLDSIKDYRDSLKEFQSVFVYADAYGRIGTEEV